MYTQRTWIVVSWNTVHSTRVKYKSQVSRHTAHAVPAPRTVHRATHATQVTAPVVPCGRRYGMHRAHTASTDRATAPCVPHYSCTHSRSLRTTELLADPAPRGTEIGVESRATHKEDPQRTSQHCHWRTAVLLLHVPRMATYTRVRIERGGSRFGSRGIPLTPDALPGALQ